MKKNCCLIFLSCVCFGTYINAQNNTVSSGGDASGTGGSVSYSVGQLSYTSKSGSNGSASEGVQQPYEIFVITDIDSHEIDLSLNVFPNPAIDIITLEIRDQYNTLAYLLTDINGKLVSQNKISSNKTLIDCKELSAGTYFLKVYNENGQLKNFKLIKNK